MATSLPSTLQEQISESRSLELSYVVLHPQAILMDKNTKRNILIPFSSLTNKYKDSLSTIVETVVLDDATARHYLYNPKLLSYDLYGTAEFWNDLLILNNCYSVFEFDISKRLKYYDPNKLKEMLNEILILEEILDSTDN